MAMSSVRVCRIAVAAASLLATAILADRPAWAAASCDGLQRIEPTVELAIILPKQPTIRAASAGEIERRARETGSGVETDPKAVTRGVTLTRLEARADYTRTEVTFPDRRKCLALKGIEARLGYGDITVLIDQRYRKGSCEHDAILEHELQHVRVNKDAARGQQDAFERELRKVAARWEGRWVSPLQAKRLDRELDAVVSGTLDRVRSDAKRQNAGLDTPASYAAVQRRCHNW